MNTRIPRVAAHCWQVFLYAVPIGVLGGIIGLGRAQFRLLVLLGPLQYTTGDAGRSTSL